MKLKMETCTQWIKVKSEAYQGGCNSRNENCKVRPSLGMKEYDMFCLLFFKAVKIVYKFFQDFN